MAGPDQVHADPVHADQVDGGRDGAGRDGAGEVGTDLIAVDWGTSRFRAYRLGPDGAVLDRIGALDGMSTVPAGGFAAVLERHCGAWRHAAPEAPVLLAGMVGARAGWAEAAYASCPAGPADVGAAMLSVAPGVRIVPGVVAREAHGPDMMRGEETLVFGSGVSTGLVCLPGTHSKWAAVEQGAISGFSTFMTGESYALFRTTSLLSRLAAEPEDPEGFAAGLAAATDPAGLLNRLFQARTRVLDEAMAGSRVGPFLSGLLIGAEIDGALRRYDQPAVTLVADGVLAALYEPALAARGIAVTLVAPEAAFLAGLRRIAEAAGQPARKRSPQEPRP